MQCMQEGACMLPHMGRHGRAIVHDRMGIRTETQVRLLPSQANMDALKKKEKSKGAKKEA